VVGSLQTKRRKIFRRTKSRRKDGVLMKKKEKIKGWKVKFQMIVKAKNKAEVKKITREYFKKCRYSLVRT
jgi:organic hydroperoxide reductase OsmC/OhrA